MRAVAKEVPVRLWKDLFQDQARGTIVKILYHSIRELEMEIRSRRHSEARLEYYLSTTMLSDNLSKKYLLAALKDMRTKIRDVATDVASMRDERDAKIKEKA